MHHNLIADIRHARLRVGPLPNAERQDLLRRIFIQLTDLRSADLSGYCLKQNIQLGKLIKNAAYTAAHSPKLSDLEFAEMLVEFEQLLVAMTDIVKTSEGNFALN